MGKDTIQSVLRRRLKHPRNLRQHLLGGMTKWNKGSRPVFIPYVKSAEGWSAVSPIYYPSQLCLQEKEPEKLLIKSSHMGPKEKSRKETEWRAPAWRSTDSQPHVMNKVMPWACARSLEVQTEDARPQGHRGKGSREQNQGVGVGGWGHGRRGTTQIFLMGKRLE